MSDSVSQPDCLPLTLTRQIADFPVGERSLREHHAQWSATADGVSIHPEAWITPEDLAAWIASGEQLLVDAHGDALAWKGSPVAEKSLRAKTSFLIRYPWDLLRANELHVARLSESRIEGDVHAAAVIEGYVRIGAGTRILPGVFIEGNVVIGENCKIGPNCYLRGHTTIGDRCHIGQSVEIKNSLIFSDSNVGHLSYVGDSILGAHVNFGAGTTVSNLRHDGQNHLSEVNGKLVDTGRRKFGTVVGDYVHTGIQTSIYPGRKLWPHTCTRPGDIVQRDIQSSE